MGWERRGKGGERLVYYRKKRIGKRVFSIYVGPGEAGERAEREDRQRREGARAIIPTPCEAPDVLQGATGVLQGATEGAMPQTIKEVPVTAETTEEAWARFLGRPVKNRISRRW